MIRDRGHIQTAEMYRTFNMGVGMILVAAAERAERVQDFLTARNERFCLIGEITPGTGIVRYL